MMQRRSFLGAMLASFTAPYVMTGGVERGVLMPPVQKIIVPEPEIIVPTAGGRINIFSAGGVLLATIPMGNDIVAEAIHASITGKPARARGDLCAPVLTTGTAAYFEIDSPSLGAAAMRGSVGDGYSGDLTLSNASLCTGSMIALNEMTLGLSVGLPHV